MPAYPRNARLAAYQSVSTHGDLAAADPHRLVLMLMDGALERLAIAHGCMTRKGRGDIGRKANALSQCLRIVTELRGRLNLAQGGELAQNLSDLYDYVQRQLLRGNAENNLGCIEEVTSLLSEIRSAWVAIGSEVRPAAAATGTTGSAGVAAGGASAAGLFIA